MRYNAELVSLIIKGLERSGVAADPVGNAADAAHALAMIRYAAVILDLGLPDEDGLSWLRNVRGRGDSTPVLVLTARDGVSDRVTGLRAGADDYLVKPFAMEELVARLRARCCGRSDNLLGQCPTLGNVAPKRLFEDHLFGQTDEVGSNAVEAPLPSACGGVGEGQRPSVAVVG